MSPSSSRHPSLLLRPTRLRDVPELIRISRLIYGERGAWKAVELRSHLDRFPEGQFVAQDPRTGHLLGMAVSLVLRADRWPPDASWRTLTGNGLITTHDPGGETLYAAGVAVAPQARGRGVGSALYRERETLLKRLGLERIRAGARIPGYGVVAGALSPEAYVEEVVRGMRTDPTLSFQLAHGFQVVGVARHYLPADRSSLGHAAVVEWRPKATEGGSSRPGQG